MHMQRWMLHRARMRFDTAVALISQTVTIVSAFNDATCEAFKNDAQAVTAARRCHCATQCSSAADGRYIYAMHFVSRASADVAASTPAETAVCAESVQSSRWAHRAHRNHSCQTRTRTHKQRRDTAQWSGQIYALQGSASAQRWRRCHGGRWAASCHRSWERRATSTSNISGTDRTQPKGQSAKPRCSPSQMTRYAPVVGRPALGVPAAKALKPCAVRSPGAMVTSAESALDIGMLAESACDPPTPSPPRCGLLTPASAALVSSALGWSVRSQGGMVASSAPAIRWITLLPALPSYDSAEKSS
jgi:hypothetical protein